MNQNMYNQTHQHVWMHPQGGVLTMGCDGCEQHETVDIYAAVKDAGLPDCFESTESTALPIMEGWLEKHKECGHAGH
jgi:hypothetical protein